jgi:hypothetical protein
MDDNSGKRFIKRSVCVPFPTPGAPTSIILAALESAILWWVDSTIGDSKESGDIYLL